MLTIENSDFGRGRNFDHLTMVIFEISAMIIWSNIGGGGATRFRYES